MRRENLREETTYYIGTKDIKSQVKYRADGRVKMSREDDYIFSIRYSQSTLVSARLLKGRKSIMDIITHRTRSRKSVDIYVHDCDNLKLVDQNTGKLIDVNDIEHLPLMLYRYLGLDGDKMGIRIIHMYDGRLRDTLVIITRDICYHNNIANLGYTYKDIRTGETALFLVRKSSGNKPILYENLTGEEIYYSYNRDGLLIQRQVLSNTRPIQSEAYEYTSNTRLSAIVYGLKDNITYDRNDNGDIINIRKNGEVVRTFLYMSNPLDTDKLQFVNASPFGKEESYRVVIKYYA